MEVLGTETKGGVMYSVIQVCALMFFVFSFIPPFWIWGHLLAVVIFFVASHMARMRKLAKRVG